jgi:hypothetical protein
MIGGDAKYANKNLNHKSSDASGSAIVFFPAFAYLVLMPIIGFRG